MACVYFFWRHPVRKYRRPLISPLVTLLSPQSIWARPAVTMRWFQQAASSLCMAWFCHRRQRQRQPAQLHTPHEAASSQAAAAWSRMQSCLQVAGASMSAAVAASSSSGSKPLAHAVCAGPAPVMRCLLRRTRSTSADKTSATPVSPPCAVPSSLALLWAPWSTQLVPATALP